MDDTNTKEIMDLIIIGGGINGVGIAYEAAANGFAVTIIEKGDLAIGTSSASTKLIHGGLRYLEYYEFGLVRKALTEREILLRKASHIIWPLTFVLPYHQNMRPAWLIRIGLWLYDHLAYRKRLAKSHSINLNDSPYGKALQTSYQKAFTYSDCWVDDARLVVANAMAANRHGANLLLHHHFIKGARKLNYWEVKVKNAAGQTRLLYSKALVNACGPWLNDVAEKIEHHPSKRISLIKGSHLISRKIYDGDHAYIFQTNDGRIVFAIPYQGQFTLIGTTDVIHHGSPDNIKTDDAEISYLLDVINSYFNKTISSCDIVKTYAGVRPLLMGDEHNPKSLSRDYELIITTNDNKALPLLTIYGGKLTTYRQLSLTALTKLRPFFPEKPFVNTTTTLLPGAFGSQHTIESYCQWLMQQYPFCEKSLIQRLAQSYGELTLSILKDAKSMQDLGAFFGKTLYALEVDYLVEQEWAQSVEDILWRRTKLGLFNIDTAQLSQYLRTKLT